MHQNKKLILKDTIKKLKKQPIELEKNFAKSCIWKDLYLEHILKVQLNSRKQTQFKNGQRIWTDNSPKKIYKWPINTYKDAQHH